MSAERLHPSLLHHIVSTLGWRRLRPLQEMAIAPILDGEHALLVAPTAGGKTEAAVFPLLSRQLSEPWQGLSVLYLCPLRALLDNLEPRLRGYAELVGRRVGLRHGDTPAGVRRRLLQEPPDLLLTTPESLEAMLVSPRVDARRLFADLRAVVVDEIHAFAGDDRGWHLLAVLERLERLAGSPVQRIGLTATVGNREALLAWLTGDSGGRVVAAPGAVGQAAEPEIVLDHVGSLDNAALVLAKLHLGEKRLVFCDSRARVEKLVHALRELGVRTHVSHSSLSADVRRQAERAFAEEGDGVIVATSTLELGLDIGDLDRVVQIDAPPSVASLLQRLGRTGRRPGTRANCLLLTTNPRAFALAAAQLVLWREGYVEPVEPPPRPLHVFAQQILALALQEKALGRFDWRAWIGAMPGFAAVASSDLEKVIEHMLECEILFEDQGILGFGVEGERTFGRRNFLEILSVLTQPPIFQVLHGIHPLGTLDQTFLTSGEPPDLLLGGRTWRVRRIDWPKRRVWVSPSSGRGRSSWIGEGRPLERIHAEAVRRVLGGIDPPGMSRRAHAALAELRSAHPWLPTTDTDTTILAPSTDGRGWSWWTFAGTRVNAVLARALEADGTKARADGLAVTLPETPAATTARAAVDAVRALPIEALRPVASPRAVAGLKLSACLPEAMAVEILRVRWEDCEGVRGGLGRGVVVGGGF